MSRNKIDVSGVLQNFAATFTKLIGHGGKNTVVSYVCMCTKLHRQCRNHMAWPHPSDHCGTPSRWL